MSDEFNVEEARDCILDEIVGCYNCQPWEGGPVWLGPRCYLEDLLVDCDVPEEHWEEVLAGLMCPNCGTDLNSASDEVEVKSQYDKQVEATLKQAHAPELVEALWVFHKFLESYPYLGLDDPQGMGRRIRTEIQHWRSETLRPATWFRARRLNAESRVFNSNEMRSPDPTKVFIPEGRYNHTGQSFLYLSSYPETAFAEIKLKNENLCAMQKFRATDNIKALDLRHDLREIDPDKDFLAVAIIYNGLVERKPEASTSWKPEYFIPRFIADCARLEKYEGVLFSSATLYGHNLVVFPQKIPCFEPDGECEVFRWKDSSPPHDGEVNIKLEF